MFLSTIKYRATDDDDDDDDEGAMSIASLLAASSSRSQLLPADSALAVTPTVSAPARDRVLQGKDMQRVIGKFL